MCRLAALNGVNTNEKKSPLSGFGRKMLCIISLWAQSWAWLQSPGSVGCARCAAWADCDINHYRNADVVYNLLQRHEARM